MSFRPPRPRFLNLGVGAGRPRLGPGSGNHGQINELFSQLQLSASISTTTKSRFSTSTSASTPLSGHGALRPRSHHHHRKHHNYNHSNRPWNQRQQTRHNSTDSNGPNPFQNGPNPSSQNSKTNEGINRLLTRLPRFLHPYLLSLRSSPSSFIVAFLILHEITAVLPGLGFFYLFHYYDTGSDTDDTGDDADSESGNDTEDDKERVKERSVAVGRKLENWIMGWMMEHGYSEVIDKKMESFERWFRRKGYFGFEGSQGKEDGEGLSAVVAEGDADGKEGEGEGKEQALTKRWRSGDEKYRVLVDAALAYAITKVLLPVRIIVSVQATPWFAGVLGRVRRVFGGGLRK